MVILPDGGIQVENFPSEQMVSATLPAKWGGTTATATVKGVRPFSAATDVEREATLLSGPGSDSLNEVPNVLFITDGFLDTEDDRRDFHKLLTQLIDWLRNFSATKPFDLFFNSKSASYTDSINYHYCAILINSAIFFFRCDLYATKIRFC